MASPPERPIYVAAIRFQVQGIDCRAQQNRHVVTGTLCFFIHSAGTESEGEVFELSREICVIPIVQPPVSRFIPAFFVPQLEPIALAVNQTVVPANKSIEHAYFLDSGIVSVVASRADAQSIEVGIYGREGMGGFPLLLGSDQSPHDQYIQLAGAGHRIKTAPFLRAVQQSQTLNRLLLRYVTDSEEGSLEVKDRRRIRIDDAFLASLRALVGPDGVRLAYRSAPLTTVESGVGSAA